MKKVDEKIENYICIRWFSSSTDITMYWRKTKPFQIWPWKNTHYKWEKMENSDYNSIFDYEGNCFNIYIKKESSK